MPTEKTVSGKSVRINTIRKAEKCLDVLFINNEFPKADLEFTYLDRRWHLLDGESYKLPLTVIEHLNGLVVPESEYDIDPQTGQVTRMRIYSRHRFTCQPKNLGELMKEEKE